MRLSVIIAFAVVIALLVGCSSNEPKRSDQLASVLEGADRLVIEPQFEGESGEKRRSHEIVGVEKIRELISVLEIDEKFPWFHCLCGDDHLIRFYKDEQLVLTLGHHYGTDLAWKDGPWKEEVQLIPAAQAAVPKWFAENGYSMLQEMREARQEIEEHENAEFSRFTASFPENVRPLFRRERQPGSELIAFVESGDMIRNQGRQIARAFDDKSAMAVAVFRAIGTLDEHETDWSSQNELEQIACAAFEASDLTGEQFLSALEQIKDDRSGLLGAARFAFWDRYLAKIPSDSQSRWAIALAEPVLNGDCDDSKSTVFLGLWDIDHLTIREFLHDVMNGKIGKEIDLEGTWHQEPGLRTSAALCLARMKDESVREDVKILLEKATAPEEVSALEVSLALLGDPAYIKPQHFERSSYIIGFGLIEAIERFGGAYGLDVLIESGLERHWAAIIDEAEDAVERIIGKERLVSSEEFLRNRRRERIGLWWNKEGPSFVKERRAARQTPTGH